MGTHPIFESDFDCLTECQCHLEVVQAEIMIAPEIVSIHTTIRAQQRMIERNPLT